MSIIYPKNWQNFKYNLKKSDKRFSIQELDKNGNLIILFNGIKDINFGIFIVKELISFNKKNSLEDFRKKYEENLKNNEIKKLNFLNDMKILNKNKKKSKFFNYSKFKKITELNDSFYSSIQEINGYIIESFSYRLVGYSEFQVDPLLKEMRGVAFIYGNDIKEPQLFTLGFHKFFNYGEGGNFDLKDSNIEFVSDKLDGSLMMFGKLPNGTIISKTKTSINSEMALNSNLILDKNSKLKNGVSKLIESGIYPICEYVGPQNRIVVPYPEEKLILIGLRDINGKYKSKSEIKKQASILGIECSKFFNLNLSEILNKQIQDKGYEGFVVTQKDGEKIKFKLESYVRLHHTKDEVNNPKKLASICLSEESDDLKMLFSGDDETLKLIEEKEKYWFKIANTIAKEVDHFYQINKGLDRKSFALKTRDKQPKLMSLIMNKYIGNDLNIKEFILKNFDFYSN